MFQIEWSAAARSVESGGCETPHPHTAHRRFFPQCRISGIVWSIFCVATTLPSTFYTPVPLRPMPLMLLNASVSMPSPLAWDENLDVGSDTGTPVDDRDYQVPFKFTGKIDKITLAIDRPQ